MLAWYNLCENYQTIGGKMRISVYWTTDTINSLKIKLKYLKERLSADAQLRFIEFETEITAKVKLLSSEPKEALSGLMKMLHPDHLLTKLYLIHEYPDEIKTKVNELFNECLRYKREHFRPAGAFQFSAASVVASTVDEKMEQWRA